MPREADYDRLRRARDLLCDGYGTIRTAARLLSEGDTSEHLAIRALGPSADCEKLTHAVGDRIRADGQPIRT